MKAVAGRGALGALFVFAALVAPAQATIRQGAASDPAGDSTGGSGTDITAVAGKTDDTTGAVAVALMTSSSNWTGTWLVGGAGTLDGSTCQLGAVFLANPSTGDVAYSTGDGGERGQINVDGTTVTMFASDSRLAKPFDCAVGYTLPAGTNDLSRAFDRTDAPAGLQAETPPAATPTPIPTPAAPAPAPPPAPTVSNTPPVPVPKAAKLTVSLGGAPATIKRNRSMTLTLKIANDGSKKSSGVSVSFGKARGLSGLSKAKKLPALKPAQKRTLKLKVKLTKAARMETTLTVTVKAGKLRTASALVLRIGKAKKAVPVPAPKKSPIVGTFWWRNVNHVDYAWDNRALYFVDGGTVYSGFPKGGLPAACTTPVAEPDEEVDTREGCLPYTFDEPSGAVTIGDKAGTFKDGKLTIDGNEYTPLVIPAAGARYTINEQKHASFNGFCGLITGCTTSQEYLTLAPDGQFVRTRSTLSTMGDPGFGPYTAAGSYPPDQHGTYEVQAGGKIVFTYADGTVNVETFAEDTKDGVASPTGEGVFVGEDNFYPEPVR
jgi:hypothetical protein